MKKRRTRQHIKVSRADLSTDVLLRQGETHLATGRFREAIEIYKQVLKREQHPQCITSLANAYLGRARELAAKGMYQEATTLWENMAAACGTREGLDLYLNWLLCSGRWSGRVANAARMFVDADDAFRQSSEGQRFAALLAGLLASGRREIAEILPGDAPLVQHQERITGALQAFCQGDDAALKEHLKHIPYRSPYRDLRSILQALPSVAADPGAADALLGKIPANSAFSPLANWVRVATLDGEPLLEAVTPMDPGARGFVLTLKGWNETQIELTNTLLSLDDKRASSQTLFKLVIANSELLGKAEARRFCVTLLPDYPAGKAAYEKQFGALPPLEWKRLSALAAERRDNLLEAIGQWKQYLKQLEQQSLRGEQALRAALVLRHLANLSTQLNGPNPWNQEILGYLARSLELDPEDRDSYLKLMRLAEQRDDSRAHGQWVEQAVRRFPADPDIVMAAVVAAYRRGAFKKAASFAQRLLKRDPINRSARNMLLSSHLGHARKQINAGKFPLAAKELDTAAQFVQDDEQRGTVALTQGFLALLSGSKETGLALLRQAYENLGSGLLAQFRFLVEGQRLEIDQRTLGKYFNQIKAESEIPAATKQNILCLVDLINRYVSDGVKDMANILERLLGPLKAASKLDYAEKEMRSICDALARAEHHGLLREYAEAALKRWGHRPVFNYFAIVGRTKGWADKMTHLDHIEMTTALDKAIEEDDHEAIGRIERFLGLPGFGSGPMPFLPPGAPPDMKGAMDDLLDEFGEEGMEDLMDALENIILKGGLPLPGRPKGRRR